MLNEELDGYIEGFRHHHTPASELTTQFVEFILIIQGNEKPEGTTLTKLLNLGSFVTIFSKIKSTSHARNLGIDYISREKDRIDHVIFLDSDSFIDKKTWQHVFTIFHEPNRSIHEIDVFWRNEKPESLIQNKNKKEKKS